MSEMVIGERELVLADRMIAQRCQLYQSQFDLEAYRAPARGEIWAAIGPATAGLIIPRALAAKAATLLGWPGRAPVYSVGPVLRVFVTEGLPNGADTRGLSVSLVRCGAVAVLSPSALALPTPGVRRRSWITVPHGPSRPPIRDVAAAVLRATTL
ncbi:hypothetical protein GPX89_07760 [Nocardia sp. ET3-3]|uniref:Uncharacterized protein n=1 Tax=Nocardia terrae TaxID=2675851 RepID=A0A7K1US12_9NOCA|nr:hypothetical protein [Nocardia terrae]MVU77143.1 hypothetical protein [Nocardia terrae]